LLKPPRRIRSDPKFMREEAVRREKLRAERLAARKQAKKLDEFKKKQAEEELANALAIQGGRFAISKPCYEGILTMSITQPSSDEDDEEDDFDRIDGNAEQADADMRSPKGKEIVVEEHINRSEIERNAEGSEEPHSDDPELWNIDGTELDLRAKYKVGGQMWYLQSRATDAIKAVRPIPGAPMNRTAVLSHRKYKAEEPKAPPPVAVATGGDTSDQGSESEADDGPDWRDEEVDRSEIERNVEGSEEPHSDVPELWNIDGTECDIKAKYKVG